MGIYLSRKKYIT